jgi:hypothetical protein
MSSGSSDTSKSSVPTLAGLAVGTGSTRRNDAIASVLGLPTIDPF